MIAVEGGYTSNNEEYLINQSFVWAKRLWYVEQVRDIAFDGNYIVAAVQGQGYRPAIIKMDLRETDFDGATENNNFSIIPDVEWLSWILSFVHL